MCSGHNRFALFEGEERLLLSNTVSKTPAPTRVTFVPQYQTPAFLNQHRASFPTYNLSKTFHIHRQYTKTKKSLCHSITIACMHEISCIGWYNTHPDCTIYSCMPLKRCQKYSSHQGRKRSPVVLRAACGPIKFIYNSNIYEMHHSHLKPFCL